MLHGISIQLFGVPGVSIGSSSFRLRIPPPAHRSFAFNAAAIPIAAGILYPWLGLLLNPMIASAAMAMSSVSVITNALRLRSVEL